MKGMLTDKCGVDLSDTKPYEWNISKARELLKEAGFDVAYLADHSREEARKAGVPMIVSRGLEPFFEGIAGNLTTMERLLEDSLKTRE